MVHGTATDPQIPGDHRLVHPLLEVMTEQHALLPSDHCTSTFAVEAPSEWIGRKIARGGAYIPTLPPASSKRQVCNFRWPHVCNIGRPLTAPARRTIDRIFERHDLITKKRRRSGKPSHPGKPLTPMDEPNAVWTVDFKGQFKMLNGRYCYPLTIQDGFSRLLLECRGLYSTSIELAKPVFIKVFREFGLPAVIRSDNGTPFASIGLARLSAWWIRLGIRPETIEPGKPQQNGRHERMHRTLKREATRPPKANLSAQQRHFNDFRRTFNQIRPHEALDDATPDAAYRSALRAYPDVLPPLVYPEHFEVRKVSTNGGIRWHSRWINISSALGNEFIGLEPIGPALWQVYFGPTTLGWFDEELFVIFDTHGNTGRNPIC